MIDECDPSFMPTTELLEQKIDKLIREHLRECEAAASAAVLAAFGRAPSRPAKTKTKSSRTMSPRRSPEVLAALSEQLYQEICRQPGETMAVIAGALGMTARELQRPSTLLRRAGRVRSIGKAQGVRYFPMEES